MARKGLINLARGLEDAERVTVVFLVGGAAVQRGETVTMWLTKEAVRLPYPVTPRRSLATAVRRCRGCLSSTRRAPGELLVCPICSNARKLNESALVPMRGWRARRRCWGGSKRTT